MHSNQISSPASLHSSLKCGALQNSNALVIGSTSLAIFCTEKLLDAGVTIRGVVALDSVFKDWAKERQLHCYPDLAALGDDVNDTAVDWLCSVVNPCILDEGLLSCVGRLAFNYHDSPLPRYAGSNATSWAILAQESRHGVSWHQICAGVDQGDIATRQEVSIAPDDTALSLNLRCYQAAQQSFMTLLAKLDADTLQLAAQDLSQRSFYPSSRRPADGGYLDWTQSAESLSARVRGLTFGEQYPNPLTTAKIIIAGRSMQVTELQLCAQSSHAAPGTLVVMSETQWQLATVSFDVSIRGLASLTGEALRLSDIATQYRLCEGMQLEVLSEKEGLAVQRALEKTAPYEAFWKQRLARYRPLELRDTGDSAERSFKDEMFTVGPWQEPLCDGALCPQHVVITAFALYLARLSAEDALQLGWQSPGVRGAEQDLYARLVPLCFNVDPDATFAELCAKVAQELGLLEKHQSYPQDLISREPSLRRLEGLKEPDPWSVAIDAQDEHERPLGVQALLRLQVRKDGQYRLVYHRDCERAAPLQHLGDRLREMVSSACLAPTRPALELNMLLPFERERFIDWNRTDRDYPKDKILQQLFEEQVAKTPDNVALVFEDKELTYAELNQRANQLAHAIRAQYRATHGTDMQPDTLIALYLDRSFEMIVNILAVLKAGGAYVPVSPEYPKERSRFILEDTKAPLLLTQQRYLEQLNDWISGLEAQPTLLAADNEAFFAVQSPVNPALINVASDLSYVIYTSGTTGQPKGVMITHQNAAHLIDAQKERFNIQPEQCSLLFAPYVFDASVFELWLGLTSGHQLVLCREDERRNVDALLKLLQRYGVELATLPPALATLIDERKLTQLSTLILAGESPSIGLLERFAKHCAVYNAYGPTEVTVCASAHRYNAGSGQINIGSALNRCRLYILDEQQQLAPIGAPGELYIGGAGLARGYLNRPELTAERFIDNPFATEADRAKGYTRLYKTGDLVRWLADGNLEYLGRNDFQVKIRGYRIELGEIENALSALPDVKQAVVIDREREGQKYLAAYLVLQEACVLDAESLQSALAKCLPEYMLPASFTQIDSLPLTINGKRDRRALPEPDFISTDTYVAPRNALEERLCEIWQEMLGLERVGIDDNFFRLGGNSISAIRVVVRMQREADLIVTLATLFAQKSIRALLEQGKGEALSAIMHCEQERYPLSFAQERMLFIEQFEGGSSTYHIPLLVKLKSGTKLALLQLALDQMLARHPVLGAVYGTDESRRSYQVFEHSTFTMLSERLTGTDELKRAVQKRIATPFDLSREPGLRLNHYQVGETHYLLLLFHHIAFDGWSSDIFWQELKDRKSVV